MQRIDVPRLWSPTTVGLQQLDGQNGVLRLRAKSEILWASCDFCWELFGPPKAKGKERVWDARYEPRYAFYKLVEKRCLAIFMCWGAATGLTLSLQSAEIFWISPLCPPIGGTLA